jgi:hypothetical protein
VIGTLALHTLRECFRRPFPYVLAVVVGLIALASHLFQAFSFGAGQLEATNLGISAVFLAGLAHAALQGTALVRVDLERGTLGLLLAQPVGLPAYLAGRLLGLVVASFLVCALVAAQVAVIFLLPVGRTDAAAVLGDAGLYAGWGRALLPVVILDAAALAASAIASRALAPVALLALFVAGTLARGSGLGLVLPDFSLFGLESGATPAWGLLIVYTCLNTGIFALIAYLALAARAPLRSRG